jgi:hypothetical protein
MADDVIKTALKRAKEAEEAAQEYHVKGLEWLRFSVGEQWDNETTGNRKGRPCLTINRVPQFVHNITNNLRINRPQIQVVATDDSTVKTAEIINGLMRQIQVASQADIAYDTAVDFQVRMGFGYWRVVTEYCKDDSFEQDIRIKPIKNAFSVYFDPNALELDCSDAKYCFIVSDMPIQEFKKLYPKKKVATSSQELGGEGNASAEWAKEDIVRIAEYFEVVEKTEKLYLYEDGSKSKEKTEGIEPIKERDVIVKKVIWRKITNMEVLEEQEWAGKYIPVVAVLGEDIVINGKRNISGLIRDIADPQRIYNYMSSAEIEAIALAPKAPFLIAEGQIKGYENFWANLNTSNTPYLPYVPTSLNGQPVLPPQRMQAEPQVGAIGQALMRASEDMKTTTGIYDSSLGARGNEVSGKAITARKAQGDVANFHYGDNLGRSIRQTGCIILDLLPHFYDTPRIERILHENGESDVVKVNQPTQYKGEEVLFDLTTGNYDVVIRAGASYQTKRDEMAEGMLSLVQSYPPLMQIAGDLLVKSLDWNGAEEIAKRMKAMLPPQLQEKEGQQPLPLEVEQQMQQAQQMIEQLTHELNQTHDELDNKKFEYASKEKIATMNNDTKILVEALKQESIANQAMLLQELGHIKERLVVGGDVSMQNGNSIDFSMQSEQAPPTNTRQGNYPVDNTNAIV